MRLLEAQSRTMIDAIPAIAWSCRPDGTAEFLNRQWLEYTGLTMDESLGWGWQRPIHPDDLERLMNAWNALLASGEAGEEEARLRRFDGTYRWFLVRAMPVRDDQGRVTNWYGTNTDIEDLKRAESLLSAEKRTLELIAGGASLDEILNNLCRMIDAQVPGTMSTVLLMDADGERLWPAAGPLVPSDWTKAIAPLQIGPNMGTCGTAAYSKKRVIVADIATDPLWSSETAVPFRELALRQGLRASWSEPLLAKTGEVLGTFAIYYAEPRSPSACDLELIEAAGNVARIAIEGERSQGRLAKAQSELESEHDRLRLLLEVQRALVSNLDLRSLFQALAVSLRRVTNCSFIGLALPDEATGELRQHLVDSINSQTTITEGMLVPLQGSASGNAFLTRQLVTLDGSNRDQPDPELYGTPEGREFFQYLLKMGIPSGYFLPLIHRDQVIAVMQLTRYSGESLKPQQAEFLSALASQLSIAVANALEHREVVASRDQLEREQVYLREEIDRTSMFEEIVGSSEALRAVLRQVAKVAPVDSTVLVTGETGTGKELVARAIHKRSKRSSRAFVRVNCAAIPPSLIASELFGYEKGAFTGATQRRIGRFESAHGGTIFLDEVGDLPAETQLALLRVLQEREFERVGSSQSISVDVRVLAATNQDLHAAVAAGTFRQDLYFRLNVFPIHMPSLRERRDDIPLLVEYLIDRYAKKAGKKIRAIGKKALGLFQSYDWPGNIRELQNVIERAVILCEGETFEVDETWLKREGPRRSEHEGTLLTNLTSREKEMIEAALEETRGRISGPKGAAVRLGIPRQTLESKIRTLGINKFRFKSEDSAHADR